MTSSDGTEMNWAMKLWRPAFSVAMGNEFPGVEGFSPRNLRYMRSLADAWPDSQFATVVKMDVGISRSPSPEDQALGYAIKLL